MGQTINNDINLPLILRRKESIQRVQVEPRTTTIEKLQQHDDDNADQEYSGNTWVGFSLTCLLSALLYLQFSISFPAFSPSLLIQSKTMDLSIFLFFCTSILYRRTIQEAKIHIMVLHLMPELVALSTIGLCYTGYAIAGFIILLVGKLIMAGAVVVYCTAELLRSHKNKNSNSPDETLAILAHKTLVDNGETIVSLV